MAWTFLDHETPFGFAHRGGHGPAPENTVAAFANAIDLGYRYLETDVHRTADGVLVAFHDDELQRVAGLPGGIADYDWDRISEVRLDGGHPIPRLSELLDTFPDARFNIDPKADDAVELLIETIKEFDAVERVCIGSFSDERIERVRQGLGERLCTSPGPRGVAKVMAAAMFHPSWTPPYGCLQIPTGPGVVPLDSSRLISRIQRLGLQVHYWTVNTAEEMNSLLDSGADAIISDEITLLKQVMADRGLSV